MVFVFENSLSWFQIHVFSVKLFQVILDQIFKNLCPSNSIYCKMLSPQTVVGARSAARAHQAPTNGTDYPLKLVRAPLRYTLLYLGEMLTSSSDVRRTSFSGCSTKNITLIVQ